MTIHEDHQVKGTDIISFSLIPNVNDRESKRSSETQSCCIVEMCLDFQG